MAVSPIFSDRFRKATQGLQELMNNYPGMEMGHHLGTHLQLLVEQSSPISAYPLEILFLDSPDDAQLFRLLSFLQIDQLQSQSLLQQLSDAAHRYVYRHVVQLAGASYSVQIYNSAHLPVRSTATIAPCLKLVFWFGTQVPPEDEIEPILLRLDAEGGVVFVLHGSPDNFVVDLPQLKALPLPLGDMPETFAELLESQKLLPILPVLHSMRLLQGLEKISEAFYQFISQQEKDIKTKKFNAQQDINTVKLEEKLNLRDLFQQLKGGLQRNFSESERGINDQLARLGQRHTAQSLMSRVEQQIQQIQHLREENFAGNIRMTLPEGTLDSLVRTVFQSLRMQIEQQIFSFKEFVKQEIDSLKNELHQHHIEFSYSPQLQVNLPRIEANMEEYVHFVQKYEVEKKTLQFADYLRAALGPIMGVGGLFMVLALMGINLRQMIQGSNKFITIPVILGICGFSLYQFVKHTRIRKTHDYDTELNRMRDNLQSESKSMIRKVSDEWQREIVGALREELNQIVSSLEVVFAQAAEQHKDKVQQAQRSVQRRLQGLEQRERAHQTVIKNKETFDRSLAQFKGELMNQYQQTIQQL